MKKLKEIMLHPSWQKVIDQAYMALDAGYRAFLEKDNGYFPPKAHYLNAFKTLPRTAVKYILFGQDPYPRQESAGGYAFIDERVRELFSDKGLSREVNRATSLRNFIKMLLVARGDLDISDTTQPAIAALDKTSFINSIDALRENFEKNGVLLLNTALIFTDKKRSDIHIKAWQPFMQSLLNDLLEDAPALILFGNYAKALKKRLPLEQFTTIEMEHPYNHTFVANKDAHELFDPMKLLEK